MSALIIGIILGILVGWNWPQPQPVKALQHRIMGLIGSSTGKRDPD